MSQWVSSRIGVNHINPLWPFQNTDPFLGWDWQFQSWHTSTDPMPMSMIPPNSPKKKQRNVIKVWEKWQPAQTLVSKGCKYLFSEAFLVNWCKLSSYVFASSMGALVPRVKPWFEFPYPNGDLEPVGLAGHKAMCNSHLEIQFNRNWLHPWRLTAGT